MPRQVYVKSLEDKEESLDKEALKELRKRLWVSLERSEVWKDLKKLLVHKLANVDMNLRTAEAPEYHRLQGRAEQLVQLIRLEKSLRPNKDGETEEEEK
jgi:hypothetical protein